MPLILEKYPRYQSSGLPWVGELPSHWEIKPLFTVLKDKQIKNSDGGVTDVLSLSYGRIVPRDVETNFGLLPESFATYQIVDNGDIVLRLTDLQNDKRSLRTALVRSKGIITSAYLCLTARKSILPAFSHYLLHSYDLAKVFYGMGGGLRQSMKFDDMRRLDLLVPPEEEQQTIARFLDHETAKIDELIAQQEKLIALLKEKRQAVISHAVTKGLNPDAPMKDSGVEWLGEVPAHWVVPRLKHVAKHLQTGPFGSQLHAEDYQEGGTPIINPAHLIDGQVVPDIRVAVDQMTVERLNRHVLEKGDIVVARRGELGRCAVVHEEARGYLCGTGSLRLRLQTSALPSYIQLILSGRGVKEELSLMSKGSTMENLNSEILGQVSVPLPPVDEQADILEHVRTSEEKFGQLTAFGYRQVSLLQERRTALISAAVTGKIDVRHWQPESPQQPAPKHTEQPIAEQ